MSAIVTEETILPGDIVAVNVKNVGKREGLVVGYHVDYAGRTVLEIQFEPGDYYNAWQASVTRVRRTRHYQNTPTGRQRTVEKRIYW